jgi:hypothetical protein
MSILIEGVARGLCPGYMAIEPVSVRLIKRGKAQSGVSYPDDPDRRRNKKAIVAKKEVK